MGNRSAYINNIDSAKKEFKQIIETYIKPLIDIKGNLHFIEEMYDNKRLIEIEEENDTKIIRLFPLAKLENCVSPFYFKANLNTNATISTNIEEILRELLKVTEYNYSNFSKRRNYGKGQKRSEAYKNRTFNLAFEFGICKWLTNTEDDAVVLHTVINHMITWSNRTYEGNRIPFGIVIDFKRDSNNYAASYLSFLERDSCAVFTDGIFSGIRLDKKGKIVSFITKYSKEIDNTDSQKKIFVPYQFEDIAKYCTESSIGVIAMTGGEIIIVKQQAIQFVRRGGKWIAFDFERVYHNLRPYFLCECSDEKTILFKIRELYCTLLDVSFAHSGGCIAIITSSDEKNINNITKERIDLYSLKKDGKTLNGVSEENKEKIIILSYLLSNEEKSLCSFFEVDRVLRKEILGLDGATVVSLNGEFYCAGSIVEVPMGSTGGGRTAADKRLAKFGIGIKISEDGYIEAYGANQANNDSRILRLFSFR